MKRARGFNLIFWWAVIVLCLFGFWRWVFAVDMTATVEKSEYYICVDSCANLLDK